MSIFNHLEQPYKDPIFSLAQEYAADPRQPKLNLGAGAYRDENGEPWLLPSVQKAEQIIRQNPKQFNKEYPPMLGVPGFLRVAQQFLLGSDHVALQENRVATCQSVSGSGALHIGFCLFKNAFPKATVYFPEQTWVNHYAIYKKVYGDVPYQSYTYVNSETMKIDFEKTVQDFKIAPKGSIFLLHACAHNPTGVDFNKEQWQQLLEIMLERHHIPFIDCAYQGFASGSFEEDGFAVRMFASKIECIVAQSFSKNFGLYGERIGACHIIHCGKIELTARCNSAMALTVRSTWSISPCHGAYIVQVIGENDELKQEFLQNVQEMAKRIKEMRMILYKELVALQTPGEWFHITTSIGMFSYTGLTAKQVQYIREKHAVYMVKAGGRACMCGITKKNALYLANAIYDTVMNCK